jgi:hypothetical protein
MLNQQKYPIFNRNTSGDHDGNFLTELFFDTVINFDLTVEARGEMVDNHLEDSPDLASQVAVIRDFIASGAKPEVVLSRLAVRKSETAHLAANMIRRQAGLPAVSLRDLVLSSLNHRKLSPAVCRSETVYLKRAGVLDEKRGGLSNRGRIMYEADEAVMDAEEGHRNFKKPKPRVRIRNAWMKFCPI